MKNATGNDRHGDDHAVRRAWRCSIQRSARIARWLVERGNDGFVVAGIDRRGSDARRCTSGASSGSGERCRRRPARPSSPTPERTRRANRSRAGEAAQDAGADAILAVVPYYNKPTQSGMLAHFGAIAEATALPVIIYNIPGRTGANMLPETLLELARRHANVVGVKESSGDLKQIATILRDRPRRISSSGRATTICSCRALALGADGVVGVASHLCSREYREMFEAYPKRRRRRGGARSTPRCLPLIDALFATTSPIPVKWAMRELGFRGGRVPLAARSTAASDLRERLRPLLAPYVRTDGRRSLGDRAGDTRVPSRSDRCRRGDDANPALRARRRRRAGRDAWHRDGRPRAARRTRFARSSTASALSLCERLVCLRSRVAAVRRCASA